MDRMPVGGDFLEKYGPWALVTGASSGIGEQFARVLAEMGLDLVLVARRTERIEKLAEELRGSHGVEVEPLTLDLSEPDFLGPLVRACKGKDIGLVVSNAGIGAKGLCHEAQREQLTQMLAANCRAPLLLAHALVPALIERGRGGLLLTGSIEGFVGFPYSAAYAATKAFVTSFGEGLWGELREHGVDVLVLAPGATDTEILPKSGFDPQDMAGLMAPETVARLTLRRLGRGPVYVPGILNRAFVGFLSLLPRRLAVVIAGRGMRAALEKARASR
jgi:short-subunit dehydrogenase